MKALQRSTEGVTDEASAVERLGLPVKAVSCRSANIKVTQPGDEIVAGLILGEKNMTIPNIRVGQGYDSHRLVEGRPLVLGGITIPFEKGLDGHSDADVLAHAIADALLGAAALGDIGKHFPDTDPTYKGISSIKLLEKVGELLEENHVFIENIDATIIAQKPKMAPHIPQMRKNMADALGIPESKINVKATTEEGLGFTGSGEGISSQAICLLTEIQD